MKKIKFAIIGFGRIGQRHAEHIQKYGELVAIADIDTSKKNNLPESCKFYPSHLDLLSNEKDVD
ncbi:MAG: Gfo/Idh/MocA family oxidoreductase, partial [Bacteroidota bacterium]